MNKVTEERKKTSWQYYVPVPLTPTEPPDVFVFVIINAIIQIILNSIHTSTHPPAPDPPTMWWDDQFFSHLTTLSLTPVGR